MNRPRHGATVCSVVRSSAATALLSLPSAQASTILARSASAWEVFARRAHRPSWSRSAEAAALLADEVAVLFVRAQWLADHGKREWDHHPRPDQSA